MKTMPVHFLYRCRGDDVVGSQEFDGLKRLNCGHITDPLLKQN